MKWSDHLHQQLDEVAFRLDARAMFTNITRVAQAANQGPDGKRPLPMRESVTASASSAVRS